VEVGLRRTAPNGALESSPDGPGVPLAEPELRRLIAVGLQANGVIPVMPAVRRGPERQLLVLGELRRIGVDLENALDASALGDWAASLEAVRLIGGRAVITRRALEGMIGPNVSADLPPLVRAIQAVGRVISHWEVDSLAPDELRARMHAVLEALDRELQTFLDPPEEASFPAAWDRDAPADSPAKP
jgi:hypothetical protein